MDRLCAVLGQPIAHSLSPTLHRAAYDALGLDWQYGAIEVAEQDLAEFVRTRGDQWRGLSLTMPLKRTVVPLLEERDRWVQRSGVANTVVLQSGRRRGYNTDIPGAVAAIRERCGERRGERPLASATVLGGGATATSLVLALDEMGVRRIAVAARNPDKARAALPDLEAAGVDAEVQVVRLEEAPAADLVASTVPSDAPTDALIERLAAAPVVFDVIYDPWPTRLAAAAEANGAIVVSGLDLLVHQANLQVQLFTGTDRDLVDVMRDAGEQELHRRHG